MTMSAAWGHGFHQGLAKGQQQGGVAGLVVGAAVLGTAWVATTITKKRQAKASARSSSETPDASAQAVGEQPA
ncbi:hypothetical protein DOU06_14465 [Clavibacter michiganensis subsp. michiganensis]|nr:hypothetical protein [Clavibacter michiganensis subsp. michiganensis]